MTIVPPTVPKLILPLYNDKDNDNVPDKICADNFYGKNAYLENIFSSFLLSKNIFPNLDNLYNLGSSEKRYANAYIVNLYTGDVIFENSYKLSEYDNNGNLLDGIRLIDNTGNELFKITQNGIYFKGTKVI